MSNLSTPVIKQDYYELCGNLTFLLIVILSSIILTRLFIFRTRRNTKTHSDSSLPYYSPLTIIIACIHGLRYVKDLHKVTHFATTKLNKNGWRTNVFGKEFVVLNNGPMIQKLLTSGDIGHLQRPGFLYHKLLPGSVFTKGLLTCEVNLWKSHRAVISKAFTYEYLKSYIKGFNEDAEKLIVNLGSKNTNDDDAASNHGNLLSFHLHVHTLEMVSRVVMGSDMLSHNESIAFHKNLERYKELVSYRYQHAWLFPDTIWNLHPYGKEVNKVLEKLETCIKTSLKRAKRIKKDVKSEENEEAEEKSVLNVMTRAGLRDEEISAEVLSLIIAGHETTCSSLNFLIFNLALNPQYQANCRKEVDEIFDRLKNKRLDGDNLSRAILTMDDLSEMKYLERCIKENMRLFPLLPGMTRELSSPLNLDENLKLDVGAIVIIFPWLLHRNTEYYANPETYSPDRFLPENCRKRSSYAYQAFSSGKRDCIGWKLALYEMKIIAAFILRHFEIYTSTRMEDVKIKYNITISPSETLNIKLKRRKIINQ